MCFNSQTIKVPNSHRTIKVPCGHCSACLGVKASRRAKRIRAHHPAGFTCWFVLLSYSNDFIPYIRKSDFIGLLSSVKPNIDTYNLPIYRNKSVRLYNGNSIVKDEVNCIGTIELDKEYLNGLSNDLINKQLVGYNRFHDRSFKSHPHYNNVSVNHYDDVKNFFKRLRDYFKRYFGCNLPMSYYSTNEYGPTTSRCHYHIALWLPSFVSSDEVYEYVSKAWPFCDWSATSTYIEPAKNVSDYIASYINCDSSVSRILREISPCSFSHSLCFGFDNPNYSFQSVHDILSSHMGCSFVEYQYRKGQGIVPVIVSHPKYVIYRYFPKIKGFGRLDDVTAINLIYDPQKYLKLFKGRVLDYNNNDEPVFASNLVDVHGNAVCFTENELKYMISNIDSRYKRYWSHLSRLDYAYKSVSLLRSYNASHYIRNSLTSTSLLDTLYLYDNISERSKLTLDLCNVDVNAYGLTDSSLLDSDYFPASRCSNDWYSNKFFHNIKYRKLNSHG